MASNPTLPAKPKRLSRGQRFERDMEALMKKHKIIDYAVVGLAEDGFKAKAWTAGDGDDLSAQQDAERIGAVRFRLDILNAEMLEYCRTQLGQ